MIFVNSKDKIVGITTGLVWLMNTGQGIFETLLFDENRLWFWERHSKRLSKSLDFFNVSIDVNEIWPEILEYCRKRHRDRRLRVKLTIFFPLNRENKTATENDLLVQIEEPDKAENPPQGIKMALLPSPFSISNKLTAVKTINYGYNLYGSGLAEEKGCAEALYYNTNSHLLESSRANIFAVKDGTIFTPESELNVLPGTVRSILLEKLNIIETKIHIDTIQAYDCFFLTGSVREIMPVVSINDHQFRSGCQLMQHVENEWERIKEEYRRGEFK